MKIKDLMTREPAICSRGTNLAAAAKLRRLPVAGFGGAVVGIVSMNDLVLAAGARKPVRTEAIIETLQEICAHHLPVPHITAV